MAEGQASSGCTLTLYYAISPLSVPGPRGPIHTDTALRLHFPRPEWPLTQ